MYIIKYSDILFSQAKRTIPTRQIKNHKPNNNINGGLLWYE